MSALPSRSSVPVFSYTDGLAAGMNSGIVLVARILIAQLFFLTALSASPTTGYLTSLGVPSPALWSSVAVAVEWITAFSLIFGVATRYGALLGALYVLIATALAHRYWEYPQAQQVAQYTNFLKNLAIMGGLLVLFVYGAGRFSIDRMLAEKR
jgi:putative oxidoreductase